MIDRSFLDRLECPKVQMPRSPTAQQYIECVSRRTSTCHALLGVHNGLNNYIDACLKSNASVCYIWILFRSVRDGYNVRSICATELIPIDGSY
jgi:hypothetical protein